MRKNLLLFFAMLTLSLGAWAESFTLNATQGEQAYQITVTPVMLGDVYKLEIVVNTDDVTFDAASVQNKTGGGKRLVYRCLWRFS